MYVYSVPTLSNGSAFPRPSCFFNVAEPGTGSTLQVPCANYATNKMLPQKRCQKRNGKGSRCRFSIHIYVLSSFFCFWMYFYCCSSSAFVNTQIVCRFLLQLVKNKRWTDSCRGKNIGFGSFFVQKTNLLEHGTCVYIPPMKKQHELRIK